jgi:hypothetical protein
MTRFFTRLLARSPRTPTPGRRRRGTAGQGAVALRRRDDAPGRRGHSSGLRQPDPPRPGTPTGPELARWARSRPPRELGPSRRVRIDHARSDAHAGPHVPRVRTVHASSHRAQYELASEVRTRVRGPAHAGPQVPRARVGGTNSRRRCELASRVRTRVGGPGSRGSAGSATSHRAREFAPCTVRTRVRGTNSRRRCELASGVRAHAGPHVPRVRTVHASSHRPQYELASEVSTSAES